MLDFAPAPLRTGIVRIAAVSILLAAAFAIGAPNASAHDGHGWHRGWYYNSGNHFGWWWSHHDGHCTRVPIPTAAFTNSPAFEGEPMAFDATSSVGGVVKNIWGSDVVSLLVKYDWDFGDGTTASVDAPTTTHTYSAAGTYAVKLTVTNDADKTASVTANVSVAPQPVPTAAFSVDPASPTATQAASFDASASSGGESNGKVGTIVDYAWDFGDGTTTSGADAVVSHSFSTAGQFVVGLTVTNDAGKSNSTSQTVTVQTVPTPVPTAAFTYSPPSPVGGRPTDFDANGSSGGEDRGVVGTIVDYSWSFGDGTSSNGASPTTTHTYADGGNFVVTLTVTNDHGQTASTQQTLTVAPPPPPYDPGEGEGSGPFSAPAEVTPQSTAAVGSTRGRTASVSVAFSFDLPSGSDAASACQGAASALVSSGKMRKVSSSSSLVGDANGCVARFKLRLPRSYAGKKAKVVAKFGGNRAVAAWTASRSLTVR